MKILHEGGDFIFTVVNKLDDLASDPQMLANDYITEVPHPRARQHQVPELSRSACPRHQAPCAAPRPGARPAHRELLLTEELGYSWDDVSGLRERGVI